MERISEALEDIGYDGPLSKTENLTSALEGGPKSTEFTALVHQISDELKRLLSLDEVVHPTQVPEDASSFALELSSFLKELGCPYERLVTGHVTSRLQNVPDRILLLEYLLSELMSARLWVIRNPESQTSSMKVTIQESPAAKDLKELLLALKFNKPPADVTMEMIFSKIETRLKELIQKEGPDFIGRPLFNQSLTAKQWQEVETIFNRLANDYKIRREMMIMRMDCTIQSFEWSDSGKKKREEIQAIYRPLRANFNKDTSVRISDFLAARNTLLTLKKTSDASVRVNTKSKINNLVIGKVPDRGGRPSEQEPPPPEMPSWQPRSQSDRGRGGGRGGGDRGRGGGSGFGRGSKVQGNWNPQSDNRGANKDFRGRNQGYDDNNQGNYQDSRSVQGYQQYADNGNNYHQQKKGHQGYQDQGYHQGYQGQGYQQQQNDYQGYQKHAYESQSTQGYQRNDRYQNEHDDRSNHDNRNSFRGGRGRNNYNRGGRH